MEKRYSILLAGAVLCVAAFACRPIIAIGWPELTILVVLVAILLGPLMYRLYRFLDKIQKASRADEKKNKQD